MKEMIYGPSRPLEVLCRGVYKGLEYGVISGGTHPCCYVECTDLLLDRINEQKGEFASSMEYDKANKFADVHGGFSFFGPHHLLDPEKNWLGWDYAHFGDYVASYGDAGWKKWTSQELVEHCKKCIDQLKAFSFQKK